MTAAELNVVVVGTGMYVCGRGTEGYGTIVPALYEWRRRGGSGRVHIAGARLDGLDAVREKIAGLNRRTGLTLDATLFPRGATADPQAYREAFRTIPKPACAVVVVPDDLHREIAGAAIEAGLHTLVAKPLAPSQKEVAELVELQAAAGVYGAVEFHKRLDRSNLMLRDAVENGSIGKPLYFVAEYSQRKSVPTERFRSWVERTDIFQYLGVHYVDIVYFATGARPTRVTAVGQKRWLQPHGIDTYDAIEALVEWADAAGDTFLSVFVTNWIDPETTSAMSDQKIKVVGTEGRYEADQKRRGILVVNDRAGVLEPNPDFTAVYGAGDGEAVFQGYGVESVLQFLSDVSQIEAGRVKATELEGRRPTFRASMVPAAVIEAVRRSLAENGRWINLAPAHNGTFTLRP